ncbi:peptidoglycan editing factor PgeF [Anaerocolumna sedimenticola]|uniref:Purine nucleoside phosphorylase n=1 Tax=Anaerocolumna sedimenticola TaxID=2696063 RepID=A0A6P1TQP7_9FIRM|nr:peptidoglycan editing factor PgeF [Anaerocolumna sedimenticola]QHQ62221.1 peptidoglycan editing factor PgeF [Anaerocolumna sedimenticola]
MIFQNNEYAVLNTDKIAPFITFPCFSHIDFIRHGFSTRLGGVSSGIYESMNLGYSNGDDSDNVMANYKRISESIGFLTENIVTTDQVHNTEVRLVTAKDKGKGVIKKRDYKGIDGLITNEPGITLATYYADCVPLYFVDMKNKAIGLSHSGWRGTVKRMGKVTLKAMKQNFNTNPEDVIALIGPSICMDCYEVSEDVAEAFEKEFNSEQIKDILLDKGNGKYQLNLWQANRHIFLDAGIKEENIHISSVCTSCNSDLLFSHRATKGKRGTLAAFLMIKE